MNTQPTPTQSSITYRLAHGTDGSWPDYATPQWQVRYETQTVFATFDRVRHYPFPLADVIGDAAEGKTAVIAAPAQTSVALATPLTESDPVGYLAWQCGPRAERPRYSEPGFKIQTMGNGAVMAMWQPQAGCPAMDAQVATIARLVAPVQGGDPVVLAAAISNFAQPSEGEALAIAVFCGLTVLLGLVVWMAGEDRHGRPLRVP